MEKLDYESFLDLPTCLADSPQGQVMLFQSSPCLELGINDPRLDLPLKFKLRPRLTKFCLRVMLLPGFLRSKNCCFFSSLRASFSIFFSIRQLITFKGRANNSGMNLKQNKAGSNIDCCKNRLLVMSVRLW